MLDKPQNQLVRFKYNANYKRHGMKPMILGNNEKYDNEFKRKKDHNSKEMEKFLKAKDENASKLQKNMMIMEVDINEFSMGSITR